MDKTTLFGLFEIMIAVVYFFITGLCVAKRRHITAFKGLIYCSLTMGIYDFFQALYYIHQTLTFSPIMLSIVYAGVPFTYLTCFIVCYQYAFPYSKGKFIKYLFIIPIITCILSFTYNYQSYYISYGYGFNTEIFREINTFKGPWLTVVQIYDIILSWITIIVLIYTTIKLLRIRRKPHFVVILLIITMVIDVGLIFSDSVFLYYFDLIMRLSSVFCMYLTLDKDETENIIFQGQINLIEALPFPITLQDRNERIIYANEHAISMCPDISNYRSYGTYSNQFFSMFIQYNQEKETKSKNENILIKKDTGELAFLRTRNIMGRKDNVIGKMYMFITLNSMQNLVNDLVSMALKDKLCGFYNRNYLEDRKKEFEQNIDNLPFTVIMCDINNLKLINDKLGHEKGDEYIIHCCNAIRKCIRKSDIVVRLGGDEFLIILPDTRSDSGKIIAEKIRNIPFSSFMDHNSYKDFNPLCIATGYSTAQDFPFSIDELIKESDENMYETKREQKEKMKNS